MILTMILIINKHELHELQQWAKDYENLVDKLARYPDVHDLIQKEYHGKPINSLNEFLSDAQNDLWELK